MVSPIMPFEPAQQEHLARALHLAAVAGALGGQPGYGREDARLRAAAGVSPDPTRSEADPPGSIADALVETDPPPSAWFEQRWRLGEADAMAEHGSRLAAEANGFDDGGLLGARRVELIASPAVAPRPTAVISALTRVAVHPRAHGATACVAVIAATLRRAFTAELPRSPDMAAELAWHCAVSAVLRARDQDEADDALVATLSAASLPLPTHAEAYAQRLRSIAPDSLDQAPGEINRIADGLAARRLARLRRAWRRGFFVPRGFDLAAWVARVGS